jgi:heme/copper-type cytochrome/quinol oxidase subunit 2
MVTDVPIARERLDCYNLLIKERVSMVASKDYRLAKHPHAHWGLLVIILAICGLTVSLATRTFSLTISHSVTAQSNSAPPMRQHMDRDAVRWVAPPLILSSLQAPSFYPHVAPAGPPLPALLFDQRLYNRPPPVS